jgi:hypothetical protein
MGGGFFKKFADATKHYLLCPHRSIGIAAPN